MSQPTEYTPQHSFVADSAKVPDFPGQAIDIELNAVKATTDQVCANLALIQRDDGALKNGLVTYDSLAPSLQTAGIAPATAWITGTSYLAGQNVIQGGSLYRALVAHTSSVFATDLAAAKWLFVVALPVGSVDASTLTTGTLAAARLPAFTGDISTPGGSAATTLATVNPNVGAFGSSTSHVALTANAKGLLTAVSSFLCRELLTADRTYYVRTDGNDSNTGSANTAGGAFLTLQKAANVILRTIDTNGFNVTIDVTGALMAGASFSGPVIGGGTVTITSTAGASITVTGGHCITASQGCRITVNGSLTFSTVTSGVCLLAYAGGYISTSGGTFGPAATGHMQAGWTAPSGLDSGGGTIDITGNYSISAGTSGSHLHATTEGAYIHYVLSTITVTLTGTPAFSNFFAGVTKGFIYAVGVTWSGAATGQRYTVHNGGAIFGPASRTALPGSTAGVVAAGGLYITDDNNNDFGANNVLASGAVTTSSPTSGIGYAAGAGGIVTQLTSKSTAVTLNTVSGQITMNAASLASGGNVTFTLNNSNIAATDVVLVCIKGGATANSYLLTVSAIAAGSVNIDLRSYNAGALAEALVLNFVVVKAVNA